MAVFDLDTLVLGPCVAAFGEAAQGEVLPVYIPASGPTFEIDGIFDDGFRDLDRIPGIGVSTAFPVFGARLAAFPAGTSPNQDEGLTIRGQLYTVRDAQPDGHGHVKLLLNAAVLNQLPQPMPVGRKGIVIGDYTIFEDTANALVILAPNGGITTLATGLPAPPLGLGLPFQYLGPPQAGRPILLYSFTAPFTLPAGLAGSEAIATASAAQEAVFDLAINSVNFATMTFSPGGFAAVFAGAGQSFAANDVLSIIARSSDATLAYLTGNLVGTDP